MRRSVDGRNGIVWVLWKTIYKHVAHAQKDYTVYEYDGRIFLGIRKDRERPRYIRTNARATLSSDLHTEELSTTTSDIAVASPRGL